MSAVPRRAWAIVGALAVTETVSWGILYYGFPVFLAPMEAELGWSRAATTGAFSLALVSQGLAAVSIGRWLDRRSPRLLMTLGSAACTAGLLAWSAIESLVAFYLLWFVLGIVMATVLYEAAFTVVAKWFDRHRVRALTLVTLAAGFASTIFLPIHDRLLTAYGWRQALVILAVVLGVITIPLHGLVLRAPPGTAAARQAGIRGRSVREVLALPAFTPMAAAVVASSFVASSLAVHQVALLVESGHSGAFAAAATGLLGAMQVPGRLLFGPLRNRRGRAQSTVAVYAAFAVGVLVLAVATSTAAVVVFVAVYGMARGMLTLLRAALIGDLWGTADYGAISGVLAMASTGATALGPVVVAVGHDRFGNYTASRWAMVVMAVVAVVAAARVEPLTRRAALPATTPPAH